MREAIRELSEDLVTKELDELVSLEKINNYQKDIIAHKVEFDLLSNIIEDICKKYLDNGIDIDNMGELLASSFSVLFDINDAFCLWREDYLYPAIRKLLEEN